MKRLILLFCALSGFATGGFGATTAEAEISGLISHLGTSGCEFNRNGSWHTATEAVSHLNRKYEYLQKRNLAPTAEAFIERAASESSTTGKPYLVKCPGAAAVPSAVWMGDELKKIRATAKK